MCTFFFFLQNMIEFYEDLNKRQNKYAQYGSFIQPITTFVSSDIQTISIHAMSE